MQGGLVAHVRDVRARKTRGENGELMREILERGEFAGEAEELEADLEDTVAAGNSWTIDTNIPIESNRSVGEHERGVQNVRSVELRSVTEYERHTQWGLWRLV